MKGREGIVYSTESGRMCPICGRPAANCKCKSEKSAPPSGDGIVRVRREVNGRGGKTVIVISGIPLAESEMRDLAKQLKNRCGTGGSVKNGCIEIQGDKRDLLVSELTKLGYKVKLAGG